MRGLAKSRRLAFGKTQAPYKVITIYDKLIVT